MAFRSALGAGLVIALLAVVPGAWSQEPQQPQQPQPQQQQPSQQPQQAQQAEPAQPPQPSQPQVKRIMFRHCASVKGKDLYNAYCVYCHGEDGKGHGPEAAVLRVPPADLTTIAARNDGKFSNSAVADKINGWKLVPRGLKDTSDMVNAMNTGKNVENAPVMPLFGPIFGNLYQQEIRDRQVRLVNLVSYVKSLQEKPAGGGGNDKK